MSISKRVVIVTGGARGLGRAIATSFLEKGDRVSIADVDSTASDTFSQWCEENGFKDTVQFHKADVSVEADVKRYIADTLAGFKADTINVVVNNAALANPFYATSTTADTSAPADSSPALPALASLSFETWSRFLHVNLSSVFLVTKHATPALVAAARAKQGASVVNISSTRARMSEPATEPYAASKGGVDALTHALNASLGPFGVRVNGVAPGWVDTTGPVPARADAAEAYGSGVREQDHAFHPAGRVGLPRDIAAAVLFLADPAASGFIAGQVVAVDGGVTTKMVYPDE